MIKPRVPRQSRGSPPVKKHEPGRRELLVWGASAFAATVAKPAVAMRGGGDRRKLAFYNLHTGESLDTVYWAEGAYVAEALKDVDRVLRDFRTGDIHPIDRRLLDLLARLRAALASDEAFHVISGYRSPRTNAMLAANSEGVAVHSLHLDGMAIDIRVPGRTLAALREAAVALQGGGVGYYRASDFIHVDVGRVRRWG